MSDGHQISDFAERIKQGMYNPEYIHLGLGSNPFLPRTPQGNAAACMVGRDELMTEMARTIADALDGGLSTITILGSRGIGKSHFLYAITEGMKALDDEGIIRVHFVKNREELIGLSRAFPRGPSERSFILIDDADKIYAADPKLIEGIYAVALEDPTKFILTWSPNAWANFKNMSPGGVKSKTLLLQGLRKEDLVEMVKQRIKAALVDKEKTVFDEDVLEGLAIKSRGVPYSMITQCDRLLNYALNKQQNHINRELMIQFLDTKGEQGMDFRDIIKHLTKAERKVLRALSDLSSSHKRQINSEELASELKIKRPTAVVYLIGLERRKLLIGERTGKRKYYAINPALLNDLDSLLDRPEELEATAL
jgi:hypothetical protein